MTDDTFESLSQLSGEQQICHFTLAVGQSTVVAALTVKVVETYPSKVVSQGGHHDDAGRSAAFQEANQKVRQQEVT